MILKLGVETSAEVITLLGVSVSVISCILTEIVEGLGILDDCACPLSESQEFIQFSLHETLRNMMASESSLEFLPSDNIIGREHAIVVVPPKTCSTV